MTEQEKVKYIDGIKKAENSRSLRTAVAKAIRAFWQDAKAADTLSDEDGAHHADYFAKQSAFDRICRVDSAVTMDSSNLLSSEGLIAMTGDLRPDHIRT